VPTSRTRSSVSARSMTGYHRGEASATSAVASGTTATITVSPPTTAQPGSPECAGTSVCSGSSSLLAATRGAELVASP
jgi:hypothetical protein